MEELEQRLAMVEAMNETLLEEVATLQGIIYAIGAIFTTPKKATTAQGNAPLEPIENEPKTTKRRTKAQLREEAKDKEYWTSEDVARYVGISGVVVRTQLLHREGFPKLHRLTGGKKMFLKSEIIQYFGEKIRC